MVPLVEPQLAKILWRTFIYSLFPFELLSPVAFLSLFIWLGLFQGKK